jgi:dihydrofolate reductase
MRKLVVGTFVTLDGVMQAPSGPDEDSSGGFGHGGWMVPFMDDVLGEATEEWVGRTSGLLLGRKTYEIFAAYWPHAGADDPIGTAFNRVPKYVASRTLKRVDWNNSHLIDGDVAEAVRRLKTERGGGELQVHGSGGLVQTLLQHDLVDEFRIWTFPVLLGAGKRLFGDGTEPGRLQLVDTKTTGTGAVLHVYRAAGALDYGTYTREQPAAEANERRKTVAQEG